MASVAKTVTVRNWASWTVYPACVGVVLALHLVLASRGVPLLWSGYLSLVFAAALVTLLEWRLPHRTPWFPTAADIKTDAVYLASVQMLLPFLLKLGVSLFFLEELKRSGVTVEWLWPHRWPLGVQVVLMILVADFLRYWLHVASHNTEYLWRLHAVHHSPHKLYWLNVGRFHPLEKTLQYLLDTLPFLLVAVQPEVLTLYLVFYGINGFFQHSNIHARLGWLNYLISGPELHRWHHSRTILESNSNYGNNLIVWDLLFGSWFLPEKRDVEELGLINRQYSERLVDQLRAPFIQGIDKYDKPRLLWRDILLNWIILLRKWRFHLTIWRSFRKAARSPRETQWRALETILQENHETVFGREHGFAKIRNIATYREKVPVQTYEDLRPYLEKQLGSGSPELTRGSPVLYAQTSGTTSRPKFIPILKSTLRWHKRSQNLFSYAQWRAFPEAYEGKVLGIVSPAVEGHLEGGMPYGSASGHVYSNMPSLARAKYVVPHEVFSLKDHELRYRTLMRIAVPERSVTTIGTANPSTLLKLQDTLKRHREELSGDLEAGTFSLSQHLPANVFHAIEPQLRTHQDRLQELQGILRREEPLLKDIWPHLRLVSTWTGGNCGLFWEQARAFLPESTQVSDLGYLSSEFRGTIPVHPREDVNALNIQENFFEFVDKDDWENDDPGLLCADELEEGKDYYIIATTRAGLYRYFINDLVRVTGRFENTPSLAFLQKGKGATNITGEKLYENQVIEAVKKVEETLGFTLPFYVVLAHAEESRYCLYAELDRGEPGVLATIQAAVDERLQDINIEYAQKRGSGRLGALEVIGLKPGVGEALRQHLISSGQREGQIKIPVLQNAAECEFDFGPFQYGDSE